jgi:hypothetical protein
MNLKQLRKKADTLFEDVVYAIKLKKNGNNFFCFVCEFFVLLFLVLCIVKRVVDRKEKKKREGKKDKF